jgi:hypothetical protein
MDRRTRWYYIIHVNVVDLRTLNQDKKFHGTLLAKYWINGAKHLLQTYVIPVLMISIRQVD